jgi:hypothetical protein
MGCIALLLVLPMCWALPTILVDSGKARCVTVDGTQDEIIRVHYEAPGNVNATHGLIVFVIQFYHAAVLSLTHTRSVCCRYHY